MTGNHCPCIHGGKVPKYFGGLCLKSHPLFFSASPCGTRPWQRTSPVAEITLWCMNCSVVWHWVRRWYEVSMLVWRHHGWTVRMAGRSMDRAGRRALSVHPRGRGTHVPVGVMAAWMTTVTRVVIRRGWRVVWVTRVTPGVDTRRRDAWVAARMQVRGWSSRVRVLWAHAGRCHPLFFLPSVAEPDPYNFLLQLKGVCQVGNLLGGWLWVFAKVLLQGALDRHLYRGALLSLPALGCNLVDGGWGSGSGVRFRQPLFQEGHQLAHVFEAELECLESADGGLREDVAVEGTQGQPDVGLGEAQLDPPLLELFSEGLQVVWKTGVWEDFRILEFTRITTTIVQTLFE